MIAIIFGLLVCSSSALRLHIEPNHEKEEKIDPAHRFLIAGMDLHQRGPQPLTVHGKTCRSKPTDVTTYEIFFNLLPSTRKKIADEAGYLGDLNDPALLKRIDAMPKRFPAGVQWCLVSTSTPNSTAEDFERAMYAEEIERQMHAKEEEIIVNGMLKGGVTLPGNNWDIVIDKNNGVVVWTPRSRNAKKLAHESAKTYEHANKRMEECKKLWHETCNQGVDLATTVCEDLATTVCVGVTPFWQDVPDWASAGETPFASVTRGDLQARFPDAFDAGEMDESYTPYAWVGSQAGGSSQLAKCAITEACVPEEKAFDVCDDNKHPNPYQECDVLVGFGGGVGGCCRLNPSFWASAAVVD